MKAIRNMLFGVGLTILTGCASMATMSDEQYLASSCATGNAAIKAVIVAHNAKRMSDEDYAALNGPIHKFQGICGAKKPITREELKARGFEELLDYLVGVPK